MEITAVFFRRRRMIYRNGADSLAVSLLLLRANYLQTPFIRGSALIEWTERKVMTFRQRLSVTRNKVVNIASRGSIDLRGTSSATVGFRLRVRTVSIDVSLKESIAETVKIDVRKRERTVILRAKPSQIFLPRASLIYITIVCILVKLNRQWTSNLSAN